jgi:hypothetical protein
MIKKGDKVIVRAICKGDAALHLKERYIGKVGTATNEGVLYYWKESSTFAGNLLFEDGHEMNFYSIQVKKVKE